MIKILPSKIISPVLIRRLCKVLTKQELKKLGYTIIKIRSKGKTGVDTIENKVDLTGKLKQKEGNIIYISYFSMIFRFRYCETLYHDYIELVANHLYWGFAFILVNNDNESDDIIREKTNKKINELMIRSKEKNLLDVKSYGEFGLFGNTKSKFINRVMDNMFKNKLFDQGMWVLHYLRMCKLGKNLKYTPAKLYEEIYAQQIYDYKEISENQWRSKQNKEYKRFKKHILPLVNSKIYTSKSGRKFHYYDKKALKKVMQIVLEDFDLYMYFRRYISWNENDTIENKIQHAKKDLECERKNYYKYGFGKWEERKCNSSKLVVKKLKMKLMKKLLVE